MRKTIEPHVTTPISVERSGGLTPLPDDLVAAQSARLTVLQGVAASMWTVGLVMDNWVLPRSPLHGRFAPWIEASAAGVSLLMLAYARFSPAPHSRKIDVGLASMVPNAVCITLLNSWNAQPTDYRPLSWITILILVYAMIAPATPRKIFAASIVAATMDPAGVWLAHLRGLNVPSVGSTFLLFFPNYLCALLSVLPCHVLARLGRQLRRAREMGSYQLVELLGKGGMGEVWRAQHRLLARDAAIKLLRPELLGASGEDDARKLLRRFEREAQATAALSSPHTIHVYDFGRTDEGTFYYVMELLAGRDLESLIRTYGPMPAARALYLLQQACHSLADAHSRGFVHRDVKPANLYVCRMGLEYDFVKVLDFGLVKLKAPGNPRQTALTGTQRTAGTPAYMAPEVILGDRTVDGRADVYALGCVAYFMLTGQLVFEAESPMKMLFDHVQTRPMKPSQHTELKVPPELDDLVLACLEKNPDHRPRDAGQLLSLLRACGLREEWNTARATSWWVQHLPEFTGSLSVPDADSEPLSLRG